VRYLENPVNDQPLERRAAGSRRSRATPPARGSSRISRFIQLGLALAALTLVIESLFGTRGLSAMIQARRDYGALSNDLERLRSENQHLRIQSQRLREDPSAIEEAARRDLGYMAPGEKVFIIHDAKPAPNTPAVPSAK
jgi:cell division protein FtsB